MGLGAKESLGIRRGLGVPPLHQGIKVSKEMPVVTSRRLQPTSRHQGRSVCSISEMLPLPDEGIVVITATCTGDCVTIADMTLELSFVHSYSDELSLELMKAGRTIKLKRVGINPCFTMDYVNATIWDASEDLLETVCPVDGRVISPPSYSPYEELQAFAGVDSCGSWSLRITDHYESDDGVFQSMKLVFMD
ncbi:unnamed protein product [Cyprideis torosa]|uniref:Uncharacterized protein n=1 Tax=Cyprideis torosa TaxID=163714 RepID=A0A7R8W9Y2_9CRUS|nr:unnamed protein product [Cyprideis torosa]CAG0890369.1 unnamed protein product [Cyprideis torosa]